MQLELEQLAREHRLNVSPVALAATMRELFASELQPWSGDEPSVVTRDDLPGRAAQASDHVATVRVSMIRRVPALAPCPR